MLSFEKLKETNENMKKYDYTGCEFPSLIEFFQNSNFYFLDENVNDLQEFQDQFKCITNIVPLILFYFKKDGNDMDLYLVIYSNKVGLIYDLILGPDILTEIFRDFFQHFVLIPKKSEDKEKLSFFIDLSNNYFLNSDIVSVLYENDGLYDIFQIKPISFYIKNKSLGEYCEMIISLVVYYVPLISIVTDNFQLSPANLKSGKKLPEFCFNDFINIKWYDGFCLVLHKESFEFYFSNRPFSGYENDKLTHENNLIEKEFFKLIYNCIDENSFFIPCYGAFKDSCFLLFKFVCKLTISFNKLDNTTKTSIIYRLLSALTTLHECGYYLRALNSNHMIMDNNNRSYLFYFWGICPLDNRDNNDIGVYKFMSPYQYFYDVSSPLSSVYSYAKICKYLLNCNESEKFNLLFDECIIDNENKIPDSLILFIQMYKKREITNLPTSLNFF